VSPYSAPIQNAYISATSPICIPRSVPVARTTFESPSPIHLPREKNQRKKSGEATSTPETSSRNEGDLKENGVKVIKSDKKARATNVHTYLSGIILCLRSCTVMITRMEKRRQLNTSWTGELEIKKAKRKRAPVASSTSGYWIETFE